MRKYLIFTVSFIMLFAVVFFAADILLGTYLTAIYTPNLDGAWSQSSQLSQEVSLVSNGQPFVFILVMGFIAATGAYFIAKKVAKP